jgi:hypothetical protein
MMDSQRIREELALVSEHFPFLERVGNEETVSLSIHNSLGEVCHGLKIPTDEWQEWFDVSRDGVKAVFVKWHAGEKKT